jgi:hypothetical protein
MKTERSNVEYPLWRKKVDKSLFEGPGTTIPTWACNMWGLEKMFGNVTSRRDRASNVQVMFNSTTYDAWVTVAKHGRKSPAFRLWYEEELAIELRTCFLMSYMRALEQNLRPGRASDIEEDIPFWEFLDIEFDVASRLFVFVAHYRQAPIFPTLFHRLVGSPAVQKVSDEVIGKEKERIHKQDWKPRDQLQYEIGALNVIYILADSKSKLIYVGEAQDLVKRLSQKYPTIPEWDFYRYSVLPDTLMEYRVDLERMLIRDLSSILSNDQDIYSLDISDYKLANLKIDK